MAAQAHVVNNQFVAQANQGGGPQLYSSTLTSRNCDFMRMNRPTFYVTKVDEDPQGFIDEVFKVVDSIGVTPREKAKLAAYQLKDVTQVWFEKWRVETPLQYGTVYREE